MTGHPVKATASIPYPYRLTLTTLEPLLAFGGVLQTLAAPESYLSTMTRDTVPYDPRTHFLYTQLAGSWLLFVFFLIFALRRFDDLVVWRWVCVAGLLQDALFAWSVAEAVGEAERAQASPVAWVRAQARAQRAGWGDPQAWSR